MHTPDPCFWVTWSSSLPGGFGVPNKTRHKASQPPPSQGVPAHHGETVSKGDRTRLSCAPLPSPLVLTCLQSRRRQGSRPQQKQRLGQLRKMGLHPGPAGPGNGADVQNPQFGVLGETRVWGLADRLAGHKEQAHQPSGLFIVIFVLQILLRSGLCLGLPWRFGAEAGAWGKKAGKMSAQPLPDRNQETQIRFTSSSALRCQLIQGAAALGGPGHQREL